MASLACPPPPSSVFVIVPLQAVVANDTGPPRSQQLGHPLASAFFPFSLLPHLLLPSSLFCPLRFPFLSQDPHHSPKFSGALLPSYFELVPPAASLFAPSHFCLLLLPPLVLTEDLLKVVLGALPGAWHRARKRCQSFRASHCRLAPVCCPAAWQGCPEAPQGFKGGLTCTFPIVPEEMLGFLPFLSSSSAPVLVCSQAGHGRPASWVSGCRGALPLCAQSLGLLLLPGVINCSAFVIVTSVFKSSPSSLLFPPGSRKLTSCLSDSMFLGPGSSPPRPGAGGLGSRALLVTPSVPTSSFWLDLVCSCLLG